MTQHKLPELPYSNTALEPFISAETLEYHYGKHHASYVENLNKQIVGTEFESTSLEEIVKKASGSIFNNAAQAWNHTFYWNCMGTDRRSKPQGPLVNAFKESFGGFEQFIKDFANAAGTNFGSGWTWLVRNSEGRLEIVNTSNAGNPLTENKHPLLTCDVWEHAYYIDYRNARPKYIEAFRELINWDFVTHNWN